MWNRRRSQQDMFRSGINRSINGWSNYSKEIRKRKGIERSSIKATKCTTTKVEETSEQWILEIFKEEYKRLKNKKGREGE